MEESSQRHLPKLTVDNYKLWSVNTKTYLEGKSLWTIVSGARPRAEAMLRNGEEELAALPFETWDRDDARARSIILSTMSTTQAGHIMELTTARAQWDALKQKYSLYRQEVQHKIPSRNTGLQTRISIISMKVAFRWVSLQAQRS